MKSKENIVAIAIIGKIQNGIGFGIVEGVGEVSINRLYIFNHIQVGDKVKGFLWELDGKYYLEATDFINE